MYRNETTTETATGASGWVRLRVVDPDFRRTVFGASVVAWIDGRPVRRLVLPLGGYLTGGEAPLHIGLGAATNVERFEVTWPGGEVETFDGTASGHEVTLLRGAGR